MAMNKQVYSVGTDIFRLWLPRRPSFTDHTSLVKLNQPFTRLTLSFSHAPEDTNIPARSCSSYTLHRLISGECEALKMWRGGLSTRLFKMWEGVLDSSRIFFCSLWLCAPLSHIRTGQQLVQVLIQERRKDGSSNWVHSSYSPPCAEERGFKEFVDVTTDEREMSTVPCWPYIIQWGG